MSDTVNLTYNAKLILSKEDFDILEGILKESCLAYNECAEFIENNHVSLDIKSVHDAVYDWMRNKYPKLQAQSIIKIYKDVLAAIRSIRKNKHSEKSFNEA